jgi:hypothetical protein
MSSPTRRNLSGTYIFDVLPGDERKKPTVFEDCSEEKQQEWLDSLTVQSLHSLCKHLGKTLRHIGDQFDIMSGSEDDDDDDPIDILNE